MREFNSWNLLILILLIHTGLVEASNIKADRNIKKGQAFLKKNKKNPDVIEKLSGLQYQILIKAQGSVTPTRSDQVTVHYQGTFLNGQVFDSSIIRGRPITFKLNQVMPGWKEGIQLMAVGDKFRFFIPQELAYGKKKFGEVPAGSLLIFEIELLAIEP